MGGNTDARARLHETIANGNVTRWRRGTRVTIDGGDVAADAFVMAKDDDGNVGCVRSEWLTPALGRFRRNDPPKRDVRARARAIDGVDNVIYR
jgi:hypothetical protein